MTSFNSHTFVEFGYSTGILGYLPAKPDKFFGVLEFKSFVKFYMDNACPLRYVNNGKVSASPDFVFYMVYLSEFSLV